MSSVLPILLPVPRMARETDEEEATSICLYRVQMAIISRPDVANYMAYQAYQRAQQHLPLMRVLATSIFDAVVEKETKGTDNLPLAIKAYFAEQEEYMDWVRASRRILEQKVSWVDNLRDFFTREGSALEVPLDYRNTYKVLAAILPEELTGAYIVTAYQDGTLREESSKTQHPFQQATNINIPPLFDTKDLLLALLESPLEIERTGSVLSCIRGYRLTPKTVTQEATSIAFSNETKAVYRAIQRICEQYKLPNLPFSLLKKGIAFVGTDGFSVNSKLDYALQQAATFADTRRQR